MVPFGIFTISSVFVYVDAMVLVNQWIFSKLHSLNQDELRNIPAISQAILKDNDALPLVMLTSDFCGDYQFWKPILVLVINHIILVNTIGIHFLFLFPNF